MTQDGVVLRGNRIVVPDILQQSTVELAHEGHQGINKTKSLLREKVWFPGIDEMVADRVTRFIPFRANHNTKPREPLKMTELPSGRR